MSQRKGVQSERFHNKVEEQLTLRSVGVLGQSAGVVEGGKCDQLQGSERSEPQLLSRDLEDRRLSDAGHKAKGVDNRPEI